AVAPSDRPAEPPRPAGRYFRSAVGQSRATPSSQATASELASGLNAIARGVHACTIRAPVSRCVATSHAEMSPSLLIVAKYRPSGLNAYFSVLSDSPAGNVVFCVPAGRL